MKTRNMWDDEAREFLYNWYATSDENITFDDLLREVREGWSEDVNYNGTIEEYAEELLSAIQRVQ